MERGKEKRYRAQNIRQIKNALFRTEMAFKGTAPSYLNLESDRDKPGSESPLSSKGYDHLEAVVGSTDNVDVPEEELAAYKTSLRKISHAVAHVRRTKFDLYRAVLRIQNDPGIIKRWENGTEENSEDWLRSYEMACKEAAEYIEGIWPGTRLYVPSKREDGPVESKAEEEERATAFTVYDSYRRIANEVWRVQAEHDIDEEAAKGWVADKMGFSVPRIESAMEFVEGEEAS